MGGWIICSQSVDNLSEGFVDGFVRKNVDSLFLSISADLSKLYRTVVNNGFLYGKRDLSTFPHPLKKKRKYLYIR